MSLYLKSHAGTIGKMQFVVWALQTAQRHFVSNLFRRRLPESFASQLQRSLPPDQRRLT
jgi:hypothetical protein